MINPDCISRTKNSTIAVGLINKDHDPVFIAGSGVIIDPEGYFITASHVIERCKEEQKIIKETKNIKTWMVVVSYIPRDDDSSNFITNQIEKYVPLQLELPSQTALDFDISIGTLQVKEKNHPYLEISNKSRYNVMHEILICGYPGGILSLNPEADIINMKFSPVLQYGRIAALMPADNADTHHGIITDIIGTGGSSGSPIIDANDGKIIGIAQTVIGAGLKARSMYRDTLYTLDQNRELVEKETNHVAPVYGYAKIGVIIGVSNTMFYDVAKAVQQIKGGAKRITGLEAKTSKRIVLKVIKD